MARRPILETAVMDVLWEDEGWITANQIRTRLPREVAPTTVGTVLTRLYEKGRVERSLQGKGYRYRAVDTREQYVAARMEAELEVSQDRQVALLEFVDRLPQSDRSRLRRILGL